MVTMPKRLPTGRKPADMALAATNIWVMVCTRTTPARRMAASKTSSAPTSDAVWVRAAFDPELWRPTLTRITGLMRAAARMALMKLRGLRMPSM
ncbi:MAG: hypothetical protein Q7U64_02505 [Desulfocapsaceae bacterium]|nr:hypothetical protein [Desulfocapsaceae bacterium]